MGRVRCDLCGRLVREEEIVYDSIYDGLLCMWHRN